MVGIGQFPCSLAREIRQARIKRRTPPGSARYLLCDLSATCTSHPKGRSLETMEARAPLFSLSLPSGGTVNCTQPAPRVYLLTFTAPPDNRLTAAFIQAMTLALNIIEVKFPKGVVVTTSGVPKFYSNGLDYESVMRTPTFLSDILYPFWRRLLTCAPCPSPRS